MADNYDVAAIRRLLMEAFSAEELRRFCQDRPALRSAVGRFGPGQGLDDMVAEVIDYCQTHVLWDTLLTGVEKDNPQQYTRWGPYLLPPGAGVVPDKLHGLARTPWPWLAGVVAVVLILLVWRPWDDGPSTPPPTDIAKPTLPPDTPTPTLPPDTPTPTPPPDTPTPTLSPGTPTPTPPPDTPTPTPLPTLNPGLGTFSVQFDENMSLVIAHGFTLGSTSACVFYHNLSLSQADVGKQLSFFVRDLSVQGSREGLSLQLYRSFVGPLARGSSVDMYQSPQMEEVLTTSNTDFEWQVTKPGDYLICLAINVNFYLDIQPGSVF